MMALKLLIVIGQISQELKNKNKKNSNQMFYFQIFQ